jgi:hypothetical protein
MVVGMCTDPSKDRSTGLSVESSIGLIVGSLADLFVGLRTGRFVDSPTGPFDMLTGPIVDSPTHHLAGSSFGQIAVPVRDSRTGLSPDPLADQSIGRIADPSIGHIADLWIAPTVDLSIGQFADRISGQIVGPSIGPVAVAGFDFPFDRLSEHSRLGRQKGCQRQQEFQLQKEGRASGPIATLIQKSDVYEAICGSFPDLLMDELRSVLAGALRLLSRSKLLANVKAFTTSIGRGLIPAGNFKDGITWQSECGTPTDICLCDE